MLLNYAKYRKVLNNTVKNLDKKIIIYPYGSIGLEINLMLKFVYGIEDAVLIDGELCESSDIVYNLDILENLELSKYIVLLTVNKGFLVDNLIRKGVDESRIYNVCGTDKKTIEDALYYYVNKKEYETIIDYQNYFDARGYISKSLFSSIRNRSMDVQKKLYSLQDNYQFPVSNIIYDEVYRDGTVDMMFCVDVKEPHNIIEKYKDVAKNILFFSNEAIPILEDMCQIERYSYIYIYCYRG